MINYFVAKYDLCRIMVFQDYVYQSGFTVKNGSFMRDFRFDDGNEVTFCMHIQVFDSVVFAELLSGVLKKLQVVSMPHDTHCVCFTEAYRYQNG
ncbi:hypothetical protein D3C80_1712330 [compost metagenome]